jgi:hypothetical protein
MVEIGDPTRFLTSKVLTYKNYSSKIFSKFYIYIKLESVLERKLVWSGTLKENRRPKNNLNAY